ncbi:hypothetical protein GCM10009663_37420 [Kitasatospora arboriphila]|uniref:Uncharacterized protein n=2 Tax=Kitasatospora arboriphila TaxID=258052 RepID=A0ABN1TKP1_9ACTN
MAVHKQWPEGPMTEPAAVRVLRDREAVRTDLPAAHLGLAVVLAAAVGVGLLAGAPAAAAVLGLTLALFLTALATSAARGHRRRELLRRGYLRTFGWATRL